MGELLAYSDRVDLLMRWVAPDRKLWRSIALLGLLISSHTFAQPGFFETEPNDTPPDANPIDGAVTIHGTMVPGDQDGFLWTVSDNDARKRWDFELIGIPGALTVVDLLRVEYADNGRDVEAVDHLMKMGTRDGLTPSIHRDQLLEPGEYIVGIAHVGGPDPQAGGGMFRPPATSLSFGDADEGERTVDASIQSGAGNVSRAYQFVISEGKALNVQPTPGVRLTQADAVAVRPGNEFAAFDSAATAWYSFTFDELTAAQRWDLEVRAPIGREMHARLLDTAGQELARGSTDAHGQILFTELAPGPTTWFVELTMPEPGFIHAIGTRAVGLRVEGEEAEPNDRIALANRVELTQPLTGRISSVDGDYFRFEPRIGKITGLFSCCQAYGRSWRSGRRWAS